MTAVYIGIWQLCTQMETGLWSLESSIFWGLCYQNAQLQSAKWHIRAQLRTTYYTITSKSTYNTLWIILTIGTLFVHFSEVYIIHKLTGWNMTTTNQFCLVGYYESLEQYTVCSFHWESLAAKKIKEKLIKRDYQFYH